MWARLIFFLFNCNAHQSLSLNSLLRRPGHLAQAILIFGRSAGLRLLICVNSHITLILFLIRRVQLDRLIVSHRRHRIRLELTLPYLVNFCLCSFESTPNQLISVLIDVAVEFVDDVSSSMREVMPLWVLLGHFRNDKIHKLIQVNRRPNRVFKHGQHFKDFSVQDLPKLLAWLLLSPVFSTDADRRSFSNFVVLKLGHCLSIIFTWE